MAAACTAQPSTIFATATFLSPTTVLTASESIQPAVLSISTRTRGLVTDTITRTLTPASTSTTTVAVAGVATSFSTTALSTVLASCATSVPSTPATSLPVTSSSTISTASSITPSSSSVQTRTSVNGGTTITRTTTEAVSRSSAAPSSSSSVAVAGAGANRSAGPPVGAIAGGVVGGLAVLFFGAVLVWWCSSRGSRRDREREFDFAGQDAWDPAAGVASGAAMRKRSSRKRLVESKYDNDGAPIAGARGSFGGRAIPMAEKRPSAQRKPSAANEQDLYYSHVPPPPHEENPGLAGVGANRPDPNAELPYGGLDEGQLGGGMDGGYALAGQMQRNSQLNEQRSSQLGQFQDHRSSQRSNQRLPPLPLEQTHRLSTQSSGSLSRTSPRVPPPAMASTPPQQYVRSLSPPSHQQGGSPPTSIPYVAPPSMSAYPLSSSPYATVPLAPPAPYRNDMASPAPSHRSIPGLAGGWIEQPEEDDDGARRGPLRVTNDEPEEVLDTAYDPNSLTAGLQLGADQASLRAPTYRTHE